MTTRPGSRFIGRERERSLLRACLGAALAGSGQLMLIAGEPGVGKTSLAAQVAEMARSSGMAYAAGRGTLAEGSPPYWPFVQVLRQLGAGDVLAGGRATGAADERFALFERVAEALRKAAGTAGLLVVVDDMQWGDPASVQLLAHLASSITDARLALLVAYRDTETLGQEPLRAALETLTREPSVSRVELGGLSVVEVGEVLADVAGFAVPESVASAICSRAGGNPFFVAELGALLTESADGALPVGVRDAVRARLARLSAPTREIVTAGAVLGSVLDPVALAYATGTALPLVLDALDEAVAAGLATSAPAPAFAHDLIREAARLDVSTSRRLALHQRMADHLLARSDADLRPAEVAFHLLESLPVGDAAAAVVWAERAADQAMAQLAWEQAADLYGKAIDVAAASDADPTLRGRFLLARARAQARAYEVDGARRSLMASAALARTTGDGAALAQAALTMEGFGDFVWNPTFRALCEEALRALPEGDSALRARLLAQLVGVDVWRPDPDADERSAHAMAMAERVGDIQAIKETLRSRQMTRSDPLGAQERLLLGSRMLELGRTADDPDALMWGHLWRFDAFSQLGQIDAAEAEITPVEAVAESLRSPLARWHAARNRATIAMARGRFTQAAELGRAAVALARRADHDGSLLPTLGFLMVLQTQVGGDDIDIDPELAPYAPSMAVGPLRGALAVARLAAGDRDGAKQLYASLPEASDIPRFMILPMMEFVALLAEEFGDRRRATEVYRTLSPYADLFVCGGAGVVVITGSVRMPLGLAAATLGRLDDAITHLRAAVDAGRRAGMPPAAATSALHLARVLARRQRPGDREEAQALAARVTAEADQMGMAPLGRHARSLTSALSGSTPGPLTRREAEVAGLVAQGLTNRQIAAALHIGERTAESHVQHILVKCGLANRSQIAAKVAAGEIRTGAP